MNQPSFAKVSEGQEENEMKKSMNDEMYSDKKDSIIFAAIILGTILLLVLLSGGGAV